MYLMVHVLKVYYFLRVNRGVSLFNLEGERFVFGLFCHRYLWKEKWLVKKNKEVGKSGGAQTHAYNPRRRPKEGHRVIEGTTVKEHVLAQNVL